MSGGFRVRIAGLRFAVTSPYRLLVSAFALAIGRHLLAPSFPIYQDAPSRLAAWMRTLPVRTALAVFAGTRPAILVVGYLAVLTFGYRDGGAPWRIVEGEIGN